MTLRVPPFRAARAALAGLAAGALLSGCAATGDVADPVVRRLTWFSFLSGDDLHAACAPGSTSLRLVHNAVWDEDVRVIEAAGPATGEMTVSEQLYLGVDWSGVALGGEAGLLPWRGERFATRWTADQAAAVKTALAADGAFAPLAAPVRLAGQGFFWTGSGCLDGKPWFHAWAAPGAAYDALSFPAVLAPLLPAGRAFAAPRPQEETCPEQNRKAARAFFLTADADGVSGRADLPPPPFARFLP
ncbi:MAG: hypothetical protein AB7D00_01740 [Rhodospirillaceae bacterium]